MMTVNLLRLLLFFSSVMFWGDKIDAQESVNASGGKASGSGGGVVYSIGQLVYTTNSGNTGNVVQGVQHNFEIFSIGTNESELNVTMTIHPNPTADYLTLLISDYKKEELFYQISDIQGKSIASEAVFSQQTQIDMNALRPGIYFVHVVDQKWKKIQSFKIIMESK